MEALSSNSCHPCFNHVLFSSFLPVLLCNLEGSYREGETGIFPLLNHSLNSLGTQSWARRKPRARNCTWVSRVHDGVQALCFIRCIGRQLDPKWSSHTRTGASKGCWHLRGQPHHLCRDPSPNFRACASQGPACFLPSQTFGCKRPLLLRGFGKKPCGFRVYRSQGVPSHQAPLPRSPCTGPAQPSQAQWRLPQALTRYLDPLLLPLCLSTGVSLLSHGLRPFPV